MGRKKKVVEEIKEEVVVAPAEETKEEPKEEVKVEEIKPEKEEMVDIPEMPETIKEGKKEFNIADVIREYIVGEPARIYEGNLIFESLNELHNNRYNVIIGDLDIRKFTMNIPALPKVVFGNLIINKDAEIQAPVFLGGKKIKK